MTMPRIGATVLVLMLVAGCDLLPGSGPDLDGRTFLSTSVTESGTDRPLVEGTRIRLGFEDGHLSASAGCNTLGATYQVDGGVLVIGDAATTEMACDPPLMDQDQWLFELLGAEPAISLSENELVLEEGATVITLLDREVADPDRPLVGPVWALTTLIDQDAASSVPQGVTASLTFTPESLVMVNTGCNSGSGGFDLVENTIRFGDLALTSMACEPPAGDVETAMLAVLGADVVRYEIEAGTLTLTTGDHGLQLSAP